MSTDLIPTSANRPAVITTRDGVRVFVSVHDAYFLATYKTLKHAIRDCHPDRRWWTKVGVTSNHAARVRPIAFVSAKHSTTAFRQAQCHLARWLEKERQWYAAYGVAPPIED